MNRAYPTPRAIAHPRIEIINLMLCGGIVLLIFAYVAGVNSGTAREYHIKLLSEHLGILQEQNIQFGAVRAAANDPALLTAFAKNKNLVQTQDAAHIFDNGSVALGSMR